MAILREAIDFTSIFNAILKAYNVVYEKNSNNRQPTMLSMDQLNTRNI
jgi:hypothetical protein